MQEPEGESGFVVRDKRHSSFEDKAEATESQNSSTEAGFEEPEKSETAPEPDREAAAPRGPMDFSSFILGMAQTALFQMGLIQIQGSEQPRKDMAGARQTIDIIAMIEEKTRGNLTDDEKKVITDTLFQLRMAFVEMNR